MDVATITDYAQAMVHGATSIRLLLLGVLLLASAATTAQASPILFEYSGTVWYVAGSLTDGSLRALSPILAERAGPAQRREV